MSHYKNIHSLPLALNHLGMWLFLVSSFAVQAQTTIKGKVVDAAGPLSAVTMLLLTLDSTMIDGTVTDSAGQYMFNDAATGHYLISASMVGYATSFYKVNASERNATTLHSIFLEEVATTLEEFELRSERQQFDQKPEKLVINLASSITSSGNTVLEVLQKSPGVIVNKTNSTISMRGKTGVRIMINEKIMQVSSDVALQILDGMSASNVESIELITTPGARYDADGAAGIIHIVTKQSMEFGTQGTIGLLFGYRWAEQVGGNVALNYKGKRFAYWADYSIIRNHNLHLLNISRQSLDFSRSSNVQGRRENVTTQSNLSFGVEWNVNEKTTLTVGLTGYSRNWNLHALNDDSNVIRDSSVLTSMRISQSNIWRSGSAGIGLRYKINSKSDLNFSLDYLYYHNDNPSHYTNNTFFEDNSNVVSEINLTKKTPIHFFVGRFDYQYAITPGWDVEAGIKAVASRFDNAVTVQRFDNDLWTIDPDYTSHSIMNERLGALYISTKWRLENGLEFSTGLRYEYTQFQNWSKLRESSQIRRKYGYLFPNVLIRKDFGNEKDISFLYARRISRPTYNDIASYAAFWSTNTFTAANTSLLPAVSDAVSLNYHHSTWTISFQYTHSENEITPLQPTVNEQSNTLIYRSENLDFLSTLGATASYSFNPFHWWEVQSNITAQRQVAKTSYLEQNGSQFLYGVNLHLVNLLKLPKNFTVEVSGMYQSRSVSGITQYLNFGSLNIGVEKKLGPKSSLRLVADDILYTNNWRLRTYQQQNNLDIYFAYDWHNQFVRLMYSWNFGNSKLKLVKKKSGSEDERKRVGN